MIQVGNWNELEVVKSVDFGLYLDGGEAGEILLPKRFVPRGLNPGDQAKVFLYHDSDNRLIATTQEPFGLVGDIVYLKVVDQNPQGAFLDWGLMKDLFVPLSQQISNMRVGGTYLVRIYLDKQTGRVAATERFAQDLSNDELTVKEKDPVDIVVWRSTDLGYFVIVNGKHTGVIYFDDVYGELEPGQRLKGFVKTVRDENQLDIMPGEAGYARVGDASEKVLELLRQYDGYLPYNDKSNPEEIKEFFGMSKKTFKMTTGGLYKSGRIEFTQTGIRLKDS
jgi:predicted RNA-binding protein (virulence factor B family)